MQDDKKSFVRALSSLLSYRGLSQRELADKIGCTEAAVSAWLNGKSSPTQKRLHKIAEALRVDVAYLIGDFPLFDANGLPNFEPDPVEKPPTAEEVYGKPVVKHADYFDIEYTPADYIVKPDKFTPVIIEREQRDDSVKDLIARLRKYQELLDKLDRLSPKQRDSVMSFIDFQLSEEGK